MQTVPQQHAESIAPFIAEASQRFAISERWIRAIMRTESGGNPQARSPKGALGLMQIMPDTWAELRARYSLGGDPYDPRDNILAGTAYLRELHDRYGRPGFLAAYNAGPGRYEQHLATGRALPEETQAYIAAVLPMLDGNPIGAQTSVARKSSWSTHSPLFAARSANNLAAAPPSNDVRSHGSRNASAVADLSALVPRSDNLFVRTANAGRSQ
ncbi:lytic transglycosylase domain-containing protein [Rhodopseudomonas pseudopalustris]|uniref:lytic transglycosylase domain-containing protein n=1 Tax=Rhodopseudomonas pseudopalustris TaxID=1513892 RepID=UPI003221F110